MIHAYTPMPTPTPTPRPTYGKVTMTAGNGCSSNIGGIGSTFTLVCVTADVWIPLPNGYTVEGNEYRFKVIEKYGNGKVWTCFRQNRNGGSGTVAMPATKDEIEYLERHKREGGSR
mgnify:CR=1 FL=1